MLLEEIVDGDSNGGWTNGFTAETCSRSIGIESTDSLFFSVTVRMVNSRG